MTAPHQGRLGGSLARRPLHFFWILDRSGSMAADGKINSLNVAVREAVPLLADAARTNPGAQVFVRALAFASSVTWVVPDPTPVETFRWSNLEVEERGLTELGLALREMATQMRRLAAEDRGFAPVLVLVSDGQPTNTKTPSFRAGLEELVTERWGDKAVRMAVGIGRDADMEALQQFIGRGEIEPLRADNPDQLVEAVNFMSTLAVRLSSTPDAGLAATLPPTIAPSSGPVW